MRMEKRRVSRVLAAMLRAKAFMLDYAYLVTLGAALTVIAASALFTWQMRQEDVQAAANAPEIAQETAKPLPTPGPTSSPLPTLAPLNALSVAHLGGTRVRPVSGAVLREGDPTVPILWEALACYQPHAGLDLAGAAGEDVLCAADGSVSLAVRDELWGWRVEVEQTDGQRARYCGLATCLVTAGQNVTRGQPLGLLLDAVPCEAELGAHLHLELSQDGAWRDARALLPQADL